MLATMPVPFFLGEIEWAPVLRLAFLSSLFWLVLIAEGGRTVILFATLGLVQMVLYTEPVLPGREPRARAFARIQEPPLRIAAVGTAVFLLGRVVTPADLRDAALELADALQSLASLRVKRHRIATFLAIALLAPAAASAVERTESARRATRTIRCAVRSSVTCTCTRATRSTRARRARARGPREAYAFARGEPLGLQPFAGDGAPGRTAKLERPLDFAAVTDHAELFGEVDVCNSPGTPGYDSTVCLIYRGWPRLAFFFMNARGTPRFSFCGEDGRDCLAAAGGPWREMQEAAEAAYDRSGACRFTTFVGYEWTKSVQTASNLHRNVIFRNAAVPALPASAVDALTPEDLWDALDEKCREAVPGLPSARDPTQLEPLQRLHVRADAVESGEPFTAEYAKRRAGYERLAEVTQHKGESECRLGAGHERRAVHVRAAALRLVHGPLQPARASRAGQAELPAHRAREGSYTRRSSA
jgi:hypothetical protein